LGITESNKKWKHDPVHLKAQELGKTKWYKSYSVLVVEVILVEVIREYRNIT